MLAERFNKSMSLEDAAVLVTRVLQETMEEKVTAGNIELARVVPGGGYSLLKKEEVEGLIAKAAASAAAEGAR